MATEFTTAFEKSGIAAGRDLAVHPSDQKWNKLPPTGSDKTSNFKPKCMADNLNFAAQEIVNRSMKDKSKSFADSGYTARAIPDHTGDTMLDQTVALAYEMSGAGGVNSQLAQFFGKFDRFNRSMVMPNAVFSGFTFFTRPRLNLADWNICADRKFGALRTTDVTSIPFAIRCYLDTEFARTADTSGCPLFDKSNPFLVPLSNGLKSISGFNDPTLVTETTDGGFFSEDQTYVIGGDRLARTYDLNCMFRDVPGSGILAMIDYWCQFMANLQDGSMQEYADAIDANRMDYTVSIYRFLMDRTNRYIARWCKCTGCYPVSPPSGVAFNLNEGEFMVNAATNLNVPFKANRIEYDDPVILKEFNILVRRYAKFGNLDMLENPKAFAPMPQNNFSGIPYIRPTDHGFELVWLARNILGEYQIQTDVSTLESTGDDRVL